MTGIPDPFWGGCGNGISGGVRVGKPTSNLWGMKSVRECWSDTARVNPMSRFEIEGHILTRLRGVYFTWAIVF